MKLICTQCKNEFEATRSTARYCSPKCRVAFNRRNVTLRSNKTAKNSVSVTKKGVSVTEKSDSVTLEPVSVTDSVTLGPVSVTEEDFKDYEIISEQEEWAENMKDYDR